MDIDFVKELIGKGKGGKKVFLKDIWLIIEEVNKVKFFFVFLGEKNVYDIFY